MKSSAMLVKRVKKHALVVADIGLMSGSTRICEDLAGFQSCAGHESQCNFGELATGLCHNCNSLCKPEQMTL